MAVSFWGQKAYFQGRFDVRFREGNQPAGGLELPERNVAVIMCGGVV